MLVEAHFGKDDVLYDLGSGDGRILIEAGKKYGCKAIGVEIDRDLVTLSRERVKEAKLEKLVTIRQGDLFAADFSDATVVTVYLFPDLLKRLLPNIEKLKPGTRIVSHQFPIPDLPPEKTIVLESTETGGKHTIYFWTTPLKKVNDQEKASSKTEKPSGKGPVELK
jgi:cyclopropane fatty-acyl-phospholipid synthase-like methyltransferase